jgi:hypothetical protein
LDLDLDAVGMAGETPGRYYACGMDRTDDAGRDAQTEHQAAATEHEDTAERLYARGEDARAAEERELARGERETAGIAAERAQLSRERQRSRPGESAGVHGEDRKVRVEPDPIQPSDAER